MKRFVLSIYVLCLLFLGEAIFAETMTAAVINFSNDTGTDGLSYLSTALPDSISATLSQLDDIQITERTQLGKVLEEIELELSGILDKKEVTHVGELAHADFLILGSFSGNPEKIILTLKAVNVNTADVLYGRVIIAPLSELFDMANQAAMLFGAIIAGKDIGSLSVTTDPESCDVYIDGMLSGISPLVEYKLPAGTHRIKIVKAGFSEQETVIEIVQDKHSQLKTSLVELQSKHPWDLSVGVMYLQPVNYPVTFDIIKPALLASASFGYTFSRLAISAQYEISSIGHNSTVNFFGENIVQEREFLLNSVKISLTLIPFPDWKWISPYAGIQVGGSSFTDIMKDGDNKIEMSSQGMAVACSRIGFYLFPFSRIHIFVEGQGYIHSHKLDRTTFESRGLAGSMEQIITSYYSYGFSAGGGIRFKF